MTVEIVFPAGSFGASGYDTELDAMLREIAVAFGGEGEWAEKYGTDYEGKAFSMFRYYWGECECGFSDEYDEWWCTHSHDEDCFSWKAHEFDEEWGNAWCPDNERHEEYVEARDEFLAEHGVELLGWMVHCSCGMMGEYDEWRKVHNCDPNCPAVRPNFHWYGDDEVVEVRVTWYKFLSRDVEVSREVTSEELAHIREVCLKERKLCAKSQEGDEDESQEAEEG